MIDRRKRLHREIAERLPEERSDVARTAIPALSLIERMSLERARSRLHVRMARVLTDLRTAYGSSRGPRGR